MKTNLSLELRVSVDVGCHSHNVATGLSTGEILDEFTIAHDPEGFRQFFSHIEKQERKFGYPVAIAMEGFNGYVRPLDTLVRVRDYRLFNINNLKLARFKEIFPGAGSKTGTDLFFSLAINRSVPVFPLWRSPMRSPGNTEVSAK